MKILKRMVVVMALCFTVSMAVPADFLNTTLTVEAHHARGGCHGGYRDDRYVSGSGYYYYHCGGFPEHLHENGICPYAGMTDGNTVQNGTDVQIPADTAAPADLPVVITDTSYDNVAFNASYYASRHADVYRMCGDNAGALYEHFITSGIAEGRESSPQFSIAAYRENNPDLVSVFGDDLVGCYGHYITCGACENRAAR